MVSIMKRDEIINEIRRIAGGLDSNNVGVINLLEEHECLYLLSHISSYKSKLQRQIAINQVITKLRYRVCEPVFEDLSNIPYAVIKGAVLSSQIYNNPGYRLSGDIDILAPLERVEDIKTILNKHGFIQGRVVRDSVVPYTRQELIYQKTFTHQIAAFVKPTGDKLCPYVNIDVNYDIFWGESVRSCDLELFMENRIPTNVFGVETYKLDPIYEFISLCMHHYKDFNSLYLLTSRGIKLSLFCDIFFYLLNVSFDPKKLKDTCDTLGVSEYIGFCIYHTQRIFLHPKLELFSELFCTFHNDGLLNRFGLNADEYKYPDFGISEYIFDKSYQEALKSMLTEKDWVKIKTNQKFM